jgi:hypothetical protein
VALSLATVDRDASAPTPRYPSCHTMNLADPHAASRLKSLRQRRMASGRQGSYRHDTGPNQRSRTCSPTAGLPLQRADVLHQMASLFVSYLSVLGLPRRNSTATVADPCPRLHFTARGTSKGGLALLLPCVVQPISGRSKRSPVVAESQIG